MNPDSVSEKNVRLRQRQRREVRAAILAAAEQVFADEGAARARMEPIAARAGVAVGTLYNYFDDRDALLGALVEARRAAVLEKIDAAVEAGRREPLEPALGELLRAVFDHWGAHRGLLQVIFQAEGEGTVGQGRQQLLDEVTRRVERVLRRGRAQGRLAPDPAGLQAALLVGMVRGVLRKDAGRDATPAADRARLVVEAFLRGLGR
jgi:AcrR family transcriptional regulator